MSYIPNLRTTEMLVPLLICLPAISIGFWNLVLAIVSVAFRCLVGFTSILRVKEPVQIASANNSTKIPDRPLLEGDGEQMEEQYLDSLRSNQDQDSVEGSTSSTTNKYSETFPFSSFTKAWTSVASWMATKTPGFGSNGGYYNVDHALSLGSSLYFDLQPFFPFQRYLRDLAHRKRIKQRKAEAAAAAAAGSLAQVSS